MRNLSERKMFQIIEEGVPYLWIGAPWNISVAFVVTITNQEALSDTYPEEKEIVGCRRKGNVHIGCSRPEV